MDLHGDTTFEVMQSKKAIPRELMVTQDAAELFYFITEQIEMFLKAHHPNCFNMSKDPQIFSLGLTFSYPVYQNAVNSGILLRWTKGFDIPDVIGQDVCKLLQHEIDLRRLPVRVTALVNDAAGTIMSRAYTLPISRTRTSIGAIFGTGTNGVYLEKLCNITKSLEGQHDCSTGEMFISIEWGSFDNHLSVLPNTAYDVELNGVSVNPGNQMFEKRVSGMFLGELLRTITSAMHTDLEIKLFHSHDLSTAAKIDDRPPLHTRWAVDSSILSIAEADNADDLAALRQKIVNALGIPAPLVSVESARAVKVIAHAIGKRAARLAGMALGAVVLKSKRLIDPRDWSWDERYMSANVEDIVNNVSTTTTEFKSANTLQEGDPSNVLDDHGIIDIGVDGSLIEFYPGFETYMREALRAVEGIGPVGEKRIRIGIAKDGSSVGAAIIALLAAQRASTAL